MNRRPLAPNNRQGKLLSEFLLSEAVSVQWPKSQEQASIKTYARPGRQNSEGFGGGNRVIKK